MAIERNVGDTDMVFLGEDKVLSFAVFQSDNTTPQDVSGWTLSWVLRKTVKSSTALISKATGTGITVTGVYNVVPASNTQRVVVTLLDTDSDEASGVKAGTWFHSLKRMDDGFETVLTFGEFVFRQATTR